MKYKVMDGLHIKEQHFQVEVVEVREDYLCDSVLDLMVTKAS